MKTLRKVSFENFERLTIVEASQLYGGTGGNPPTTPLPTDSIPPNRNDSIPPTIPPTHTFSGGVQYKRDGSFTTEFEYGVGKGKYKGNAKVSYNTKTGIEVSVGGSITIGGKKN